MNHPTKNISSSNNNITPNDGDGVHVEMRDFASGYSPFVASVRRHLQPNGSIRGADVAETILPLFPDMCSAVPTTSTPVNDSSQSHHAALASIDGRHPISHDRVVEFCLKEFGPAIHRLGFGRGDRIALVLPNGPELALAILSTVQWASCVPLNAAGSVNELENDLMGASVDLVIGPYTGTSVHQEPVASSSSPSQHSNTHHKYAVMPTDPDSGSDFLAYEHVQETALRLGIPFVGLVPSKTESGIFSLVGAKSPTGSVDDSDAISVKSGLSDSDLLFINDKTSDGLNNGTKDENPKAAVASLGGGESNRISFRLRKPNNTSQDKTSVDVVTRKQPNSQDDEVLVLFTSGTTGSKKLVPHCLGEMLTAAATIALSWDLTPQDVNCNLMPLFHVGGIVRQVFSPLVSGGCVICCPSFDPSIFWALLNNKAFNWYYAAPTMHQIILATGHEQVQIKGHSSNLEEQTHPELKMIANAAGGLLPSLANELKKTFKANVLPSYGMTECMPISSPPSNYQLDRPGTSGVAVGPEIAILNISTMEPLKAMEEGPICVRGTPCFKGYGHNAVSAEKDATEAGASFLQDGWFNTGDLGYLDQDGYLYITGRSKEVINRGGEIISPLEVEEAVSSHPDVDRCIAFSAAHDVLQEIVGIAIVPVANKPKIDLHSLHEYLGEERLGAAKWPQCLVFMDDLPKSNTNKLLRVKLAERLKLPEFNDGLYPIERTFVAQCPPKGTPVKTPIDCERVLVDHAKVLSTLKQEFMPEVPTDDLLGFENIAIPTNCEAIQCQFDQKTGPQLYIVNHPSRIGAIVCHVKGFDRIDVIRVAQEKLDKFCIPSHFCLLSDDALVRSERDLLPPSSEDALSSVLQAQMEGNTAPIDPLVREMQETFQELLDLDCKPHVSTNFFNLGGSSMLGSQLAARIRKRHMIPMSGAEVFHHASCEALGKVIKERKADVQEKLRGRNTPSTQSGAGPDTLNSIGSLGSVLSMRKDLDYQEAHFTAKRIPAKNTWWSCLVQLIPITFLFPLVEFTRFFLFFMTLLHLKKYIPGPASFLNFIITAVLFNLVWLIFLPLLFVLIKWVFIGKYRSGRHQIWGAYYLRWWLVDVCRKLCGKGLFGSNETTLNWYYRLLGAKIGKSASISVDAEIAEFDLVSIGEGAAVEFSTLRPFSLDNGTMMLGPVGVGNNASVGIYSVVAPFTRVPNGCHLGPHSTSYEPKAMDHKHARYNRYNFPDPHWAVITFGGHLITLIINLIAQIPPLYILKCMVRLKGDYPNGFNNFGALLEWLCDPRRIPYYVAIRIARKMVSPLVHTTVSIIFKRLVIGKFVAGPKDTTSQWQLLRYWLVATLFSRENLCATAEIIGRHYEGISIMYRLLGAKVGKRVFWPGTNNILTGEFDLLEIGDDVIFGSRAVVFTGTADSAEHVRLCAGSNLSDNCVIFPGAIMGKNAALGSSGFCPGGWYLPEQSLWVGQNGGEPVLLEKGVSGIGGDQEIGDIKYAKYVPLDKLQMTGDESTLRPFGKAIYNRQASYFVWPIWMVVIMNGLVTATFTALKTLPIIGALHVGAGTLYGFPISERSYGTTYYGNVKHPLLHIYIWIFGAMLLTNFCFVLCWVAWETISKWTIIGRRQEGIFNWDTSSFNQRWEFHQAFQRIRYVGNHVSMLDLIDGTPYMPMFFRLQGAKIGKDVCLYPTSGDPYMSEPCLLTIGDRAAIDCVSLVCHLNTRGNFAYFKTKIGNDTTVRTKSRLQQGSVVEDGSMILEHSLLMTGEVVDANSVWYGAPAEHIFQLGYSSDGLKSTFDTTAHSNIST